MLFIYYQLLIQVTHLNNFMAVCQSEHFKPEWFNGNHFVYIYSFLLQTVYVSQLYSIIRSFGHLNKLFDGNARLSYYIKGVSKVMVQIEISSLGIEITI